MDLDPTKWGGLQLGLKICPVKTSTVHYHILGTYNLCRYDIITSEAEGRASSTENKGKS